MPDLTPLFIDGTRTEAEREPRERPILFSGPMVRAILAGQKTQTRRIASNDGHHMLGDDWRFVSGRHSPYGQVGDRLWVRETWGPCAGGVVYKADDVGENIACPDGGRWRPSIYMPRWASRITLEVTRVRLERLQAIDGYDCMSEGVRISRCDCERCRMSAAMCPADESGHIMEFATLWDAINGKRAPWSSNPWVWAISFRRLGGES